MSELTKLYETLLRAWNDRDAKAMAANFADGAVMIGFDGSTAEGPQQIEAHLAPIFRDHPTAAYVSILRSEHDLGDMSMLLADAGMVPPGKADIRSETIARQTLLARRSGGQWRIVQFQNTPITLDADKDQRGRIYEELQSAHRAGGLLH
jgi:uncharacterized protein (TIGR02246 family)